MHPLPLPSVDPIQQKHKFKIWTVICQRLFMKQNLPMFNFIWLCAASPPFFPHLLKRLKPWQTLLSNQEEKNYQKGHTYRF